LNYTERFEEGPVVTPMQIQNSKQFNPMVHSRDCQCGNANFCVMGGLIRKREWELHEKNRKREQILGSSFWQLRNRGGRIENLSVNEKKEETRLVSSFKILREMEPTLPSLEPAVLGCVRLKNLVPSSSLRLGGGRVK